MALKLTLLFFLSVWHMGKTKTKFGQIINSSHSSIIHSDSKTVLNLDLLSKSPWRQIRRSTCIPLYCHDFIFFGQTRTEHLCCTLLTTTNYVTGVALKDRCDHTAMTKQLFNRYKISSQCFFHVISSKKIQQLAASGPWPTEHVVEMSLGARKYHTWDPENVGSFWGRISMYHAHACVSWSKFHVGRCKTICSGMWSWHWLVLDKYNIYIYLHIFTYRYMRWVSQWYPTIHWFIHGWIHICIWLFNCGSKNCP